MVNNSKVVFGFMQSKIATILGCVYHVVMSNSLTILRVVIASSLWQTFDYLSPENMAPQDLQPGMRVHVPFGRREMIGVILEVVSQSDIATHKLKK